MKQFASARRHRSESYLDMPSIIAAAEVTDAIGIHPGYGFLSENADFAERVETERLCFHRPAGQRDSPDGRQGFRYRGHEGCWRALRTWIRRATGRRRG